MSPEFRQALADFDPVLDRSVRQTLTEAGVPGAAIALSLAGRDVIGVYGIVDANENLPVTDHTAFDIGSCSKAFVATAIAFLVNSGRIRLDDRAKEYLPDLEFDQESVTEAITIRDLLCNRTGLKRQIPIAAYADPEITAAQILSRVRYLERASAFRHGYVYFNPGFMACALVIERVSGVPYADFLERELFSPMGMNNSASGTRVIQKLPGRASGHTFSNGEAVPLSGPVYHNLEGAGGVYSSAGDVIRWMRFHLQKGRVGTSQLVDAEILAETHQPHTRIPDAECKLIHRPPGAQRCDYCMGWWLTEFHGQPLIQHAGEALGWRAMISLLPQADLGVSVFLSAAQNVHQAISYTIIEKLLTGGSRDWVALASADAESIRHQIEQAAESRFPCVPGSPSALPLASLAGRYHHAACGEVRVSQVGSGLLMQFADGRIWNTGMTHLGENVFECRLLRPEARDFMPGTWRARFEVRDGHPVWLEDLNATYSRLA